MASETVERLVFDEVSDQIVIEEVLRDEGPSRLRQCKSAVDQIRVPDAPDNIHFPKLCRSKSYVGGLIADSGLNDRCPYRLRRCESME